MYLPIKILSKSEKKEIEKKLQDQFGIDYIPGILLQRGQERIFLYQGDFSEEQIKILEKTSQVERIGLYFCKFQNEEIRLSIEGTQILKDQIKENIFELDKEQTELWMKGNELNVSSGMNGIVVMKYKNDFF